jgi:hypothetical protein
MAAARHLADGRSTNYGCGIGTRDIEGDTVLSHSGAVNGFLAYASVVPRTRSAVVVLSNSDDGDAAPMFRTLRRLVLRDAVPLPPKVSGVTAKEAATTMFQALQSGQVDRSLLGADFSAFLTEDRLRGAAVRLGPLGKIENVRVEDTSERGGMETTSVAIELAHGATRRAAMFRSADGKVQQFILEP